MWLQAERWGGFPTVGILALVLCASAVAEPSGAGFTSEDVVSLVAASEGNLEKQLGGFCVSYAIGVYKIDQTNSLQRVSRFVHRLSRQDGKWRHETEGVRIVNPKGEGNDNTSIEVYNNGVRRVLLQTGTVPGEAKSYSGHVWPDDTLFAMLSYMSFMGVAEQKPLSEFLAEHVKEISKVRSTKEGISIEINLESSGAKIVVLLDPDKHYLMRDMTVYDKSGDMVSHTRISPLELAPDTWVAGGGVIENLSPNAGLEPVVVSRIELEPLAKTEFRINEEFSDREFDLKFPLETMVFDHLRKIRYPMRLDLDRTLDNLASLDKDLNLEVRDTTSETRTESQPSLDPLRERVAGPKRRNMVPANRGIGWFTIVAGLSVLLPLFAVCHHLRRRRSGRRLSPFSVEQERSEKNTETREL